jgi:hypothetical protein
VSASTRRLPSTTIELRARRFRGLRAAASGPKTKQYPGEEQAGHDKPSSYLHTHVHAQSALNSPRGRPQGGLLASLPQLRLKPRDDVFLFALNWRAYSPPSQCHGGTTADMT